MSISQSADLDTEEDNEGGRKNQQMVPIEPRGLEMTLPYDVEMVRQGRSGLKSHNISRN